MRLALTVLMNQLVDQAIEDLRSFLRWEDGQDAFEYMLIMGGISVAAVVAVVVLVAGGPGLRTATCAAIAQITQYSTFSC